ncbi:MAG: NAD-dependent epimerase/dehydratase family protein [Promethearchaeota archaeon]
MSKKVLVTGGAGFIGSHLVDQLIHEKGYDVTIIDSLEEQVHGKNNRPPDYLNKNSKFNHASIIEYKDFRGLVEEADIIFHLAAKVGVGQSMYKIKDYVDSNIGGLGNLLDILVNSEHNVQKLVLASSNTVYGEGKYNCSSCGVIYPELRQNEQLKHKEWDIKCPNCGKIAKPLLTSEDSILTPSSIYAFSKLAQEKMGLMIGETYGINTTVLRFFLTYGTRQSLSNPYTGVCAIFSSRTLNGKSPIVFEDGNQSRDFVHVSDICQALILAMEKKAANGEIFNVGTGIAVTIGEVAEIITEKINSNLKPIFNQNYRIGDIRHCIADISKIKTTLGYSPTLSLKEGIDDLISWIKVQKNNIKENSLKAMEELKEKGLLK